MSSNNKKKHSPLAKSAEHKISQYLATASSFFIVCIFVVHPLMIDDGYYNITKTKRYTFVSIWVIYLLAIAAIFLYYFISNKRPRGSWPAFSQVLHMVRPYEYALLCYWAILCISTAMSADPKMSLLGYSTRNEGLLMQSAYLLTVVLLGRLYRPQKYHLFLLCATAVVVSTYGILQYYGYDFLGLNPFTFENELGPGLLYFSTMSNRNMLSTYLSLVLPVSIVLFTHAIDRSRWIYLLFSGCIFYMMLLASTESGYVGLLVATLALFPFLICDWKRLGWLCLTGCCFSILLWICLQSHIKNDWVFEYIPFLPAALPLAGIFLVVSLAALKCPLPFPSPRKYRIVAYLLLAVIIALSLFVLVPALAEITGNNTLNELSDILSGNLEDSYGSNRGFIWKRALQLVPERPFFGHGPDNFYPVFNDRFSTESQALHPDPYDKAHNEYIQALVDCGVLGLLSILSFYVLILWKAGRQLTHVRVLALVYAMAVFLVQAFFNFSTPFAHPIIWSLWGMLAAHLYRPGLDKHSPKTN